MTQMLRRLAFVLLGRRQDFHRAARLLDRRDGGFRSAMNLDIKLGLELTPAEQPHAILRAPDHAGFPQRFGVDGAAGVVQLGIYRVLNAVVLALGKFEPAAVFVSTLSPPPTRPPLATFL